MNLDDVKLLSKAAEIGMEVDSLVITDEISERIKENTRKYEQRKIDNKEFDLYLCMSDGEKAQVFELGNMDFSLACKVHLAVMKELEIELQGVEQYEEVHKVYDATIRMDDNKEKGKMGIHR